MYQRNISLVRSMLGIDRGIDVYDHICKAISGVDTTTEEVLDRLMAPEDVEDLKEGRLSYESLKCFIRVWIDMGKPKQN